MFSFGNEALATRVVSSGIGKPGSGWNDIVTFYTLILFTLILLNHHRFYLTNVYQWNDKTFNTFVYQITRLIYDRHKLD